MKILIAYASVQGTTKKCAEMLGEQLSKKNDVKLVDINKSQIPDTGMFDAVILGSSVRMAKIAKKLRHYIKNNKDALLKTECGVFLCCGIPDEFDAYAKEQMPKGFEPSLGVVYFGGELKPKETKGIIDKLIIGAMRKEITEHDFEDGNFDGSLPEILPENISNFADKVNEVLYKQKES